MNNGDKKKNAKNLTKIIISITRTFTGTGTPKDWINTALFLLPIVFVTLFGGFILLYAIVMTPLSKIQNTIHKITNVLTNVGNGVSSFFNKTWNAITFHGWVEDDEKYANKLKSVYEDYKDDGTCIDDTLITATLTFKYIVSNEPDSADDIDYSDDEDDKDFDYDEMTRKIRKLAKKQINNGSASSADFLAYLRSGNVVSDTQREDFNNPSSDGTNSSVAPGIDPPPEASPDLREEQQALENETPTTPTPEPQAYSNDSNSNLSLLNNNYSKIKTVMTATETPSTEAPTQEPTNENSNEEEEQIDESLPNSVPLNKQTFLPPSNLGKEHTWTGWFDWDWDSTSNQGKLIKDLGTSNKTLGGYVDENELGFVTYGQWYAAATTLKFGNVGDMLFVEQDDGSIFPVIIADIKSSSDPGINEWGHNQGKCMVEFETGEKWDRNIGECAKVQPAFDHYIKSVTNIGSVYTTPQYINNAEQALKDANLDTSTFIDVGAVSTGSYVGSIGNNNTNGQRCPAYLEYKRPSNEEIESINYKNGFVYKYNKRYFENYDGVELNYAVENFIRDIYGYKSQLKSQIDDETTSSGNGSRCNISGEFESWLQSDPEWGNIFLGNSSAKIKDSGCLVTAISMLMMKSGTQLNVDNFNPGVFVQTLNQHGGFVGASFANNPASWQSIAPNWGLRQSDVPLTGDRKNKTNQIKEQLDNGNYVVVRTYHPREHWVAIDRIEGDTIYMMDPATNRTKLWDDGEYTVENTNTMKTFYAMDAASNPITSTGVCASASGEYKYYNQANVGNTNDGIHYGSYVSKCRGQNLNAIGCSQMSLAIVVSGLVSPDITPITVADYYCDVGINHSVSMYDVVNDELMEKLGLSAYPLFNSSDSREIQKKKLQDIIDKGYPVIINVTNHFVAVVPGDNGTLRLMDPGSQEKTKNYTMDEFQNVSWHESTNWKIAYYFTKRSS